MAPQPFLPLIGRLAGERVFPKTLAQSSHASYFSHHPLTHMHARECSLTLHTYANKSNSIFSTKADNPIFRARPSPASAIQSLLTYGYINPTSAAADAAAYLQVAVCFKTFVCLSYFFLGLCASINHQSVRYFDCVFLPLSSVSLSPNPARSVQFDSGPLLLCFFRFLFVIFFFSFFFIFFILAIFRLFCLCVQPHFG